MSATATTMNAATSTANASTANASTANASTANASTANANASERFNHFQAISQMVINGHIVHKLDFLASISIYGSPYFNVFRRYNSPYEIVVEDLNADFHFFRNITVKETIQDVLCLSDEQMETFHVENAISIKKYGCVDFDATMNWIQLQQLHEGVMLNVEGILSEYPYTSVIYDDLPGMMGSFLPVFAPANSPVVNRASQCPGAPLKADLPELTLCDNCVEDNKENLFEAFSKLKGLKRKIEEVEEQEEQEEEQEEEEQEEQEQEEQEEEEVEEEEQEEEEEEKQEEELSYLCLRNRILQRFLRK